jgi:uncharacterized protein YwgA
MITTDRIIEMNVTLANESKYTTMLYALKRFGSIPGKEALQKIMYFASIKSNSTSYSFQWNKYGPYSEELKYAFDDAIMEGTIDYYLVDPPMEHGQQFNIKLTTQGEELLNSCILDNDVREPIEFAYQILKNKNPIQMELLSSVHYIVRHNDDDSSGKTSAVLFVLDILRKLKPGARFKQEDIISILEELEEHNMLI